jgi:hypothetical protein
VLFLLDEFAQLGHMEIIEDNYALMRDFFDLRPNFETELEIPGELGRLKIPAALDAVIAIRRTSPIGA